MILGNLAALKLTVGDVSAAIHFNQQALTLRLGHRGSASLDVAASYGNLADLSLRCGQFKDAVVNADKCMETVEKALPTSNGSDNPPTPPVSGAHRPNTVLTARRTAGGGGVPIHSDAAPAEKSVVNACIAPPQHQSKVRLPQPLPPARHHPYYLKASSIKAAALRELRRSQFRKASHT
jgi:hypothetical protein